MNKFRTMSVFVIMAMLFSFANVSTASAATVDSPWTGSGSGTTTVVSDGSSAPAEFRYNNPGPFSGAWTFSTTAALAGSHDLSWVYGGFHSFFKVTVSLVAFVDNGTTVTNFTLINAGPVNCCSSPSNGFHYTGSYTFNVQPGDIYGFKMTGSHFDSSRAMGGTLTVDETTAVAGGPYHGGEGFAIALDGSGSYDPNGNPLTYNWTVSDTIVCSFDNPNIENPNLTCIDNGDFPTQITVNDGAGSDNDSTVVYVLNLSPTLDAISVDQALVAVDTAINASAGFTDPGTLDTHSAVWDWGDGTSEGGTVTQGAGSGSVNDSHVYSVPGVYTVKLSVADNDGGESDESVYQYVVVYDPSAGFVTGGGWFNSPAGAYTDDPSLTGKANFGFVAKYKKGANVPDGNTQFQFSAGDLNFHSSSYEWLVVAGNQAMFKGEGTINGQGDRKSVV